MIAYDYSQICIAALTPFFDDLAKDPLKVEDLARHAILSKIKSLKKKFPEFAKEIVIACDGNHYWRKDIFSNYKAGRKKAREESDIPWVEIHRVMDIIREELKENTMYKVLRHPNAEADDIMAILALHVANKRLVEVGLEMDYQPYLMLTSDGDMKQLHISPNIKQYSPMHDKYVKLDKGVTAKEFLRRKILTGDSGDGICNVFSDKDSLINGVRQKPASEKKMAPLLACERMEDGTDDEELKKRIILNEELISFDKIPQWLIDEVIDMYDQKPNGDRMKLYKYLAEKRCKLLLSEIQQF